MVLCFVEYFASQRQAPASFLRSPKRHAGERMDLLCFLAVAILRQTIEYAKAQKRPRSENPLLLAHA